MKKSTYKHYMTESFISDAKITAKRDKISDRPGEKTPYETSGGYWAGKHKGEIEYFDSEEKAKAYIQYGHAADNEPGGTGGEAPDKPEPNQTSISATGGFGGDDKDAGAVSVDKKAAEKEQAKDELEQFSDPDEMGDWLENHQDKLGKKNTDELASMHSDIEDSYMDARDNDNWDDFDEKVANFKKTASDMLDKPSKSSSSRHPGPGGMMGALGHRGSQYRTGTENIKVINGKKYKPIKESKKSNKHFLKENYDRFFGDK